MDLETIRAEFRRVLAATCALMIEELMGGTVVGRTRIRTGLLTRRARPGGPARRKPAGRGGVRVWDHARGVDHRVYLQELTNSDQFAFGIWATTEAGPLRRS